MGKSPSSTRLVRVDGYAPHRARGFVSVGDPPSRHGAAIFLKAYASQALQAKPPTSAGLRSEHQGIGSV
jgi:hypothetical protein